MSSCSSGTSSSSDKEPLHLMQFETKRDQKINDYWFNGKAEITSYNLVQARYGELREGEAVTIFVSEPFSPNKMTKADQAYSDNVSVLKCNFTKRFNTGIYPYSLMSSTFFPFEHAQYSPKVSMSMQEWCGHVYMEMQNKKDFQLTIHSYFEGETAQLSMKKAALEDDFWSKIRLNPSAIEEGNFKVIPSFFYIRLMHKEPKAYACSISKKEDGEFEILHLTYPELKRSLSIRYQKAFPHAIESWKESYPDGFGPNAAILETSGTKIKSIRSDYWNRHDNADLGMRKELGLKL